MSEKYKFTDPNAFLHGAILPEVGVIATDGFAARPTANAFDFYVQNKSLQRNI